MNGIAEIGLGAVGADPTIMTANGKDRPWKCPRVGIAGIGLEYLWENGLLWCMM